MDVRKGKRRGRTAMLPSSIHIEFWDWWSLEPCAANALEGEMLGPVNLSIILRHPAGQCHFRISVKVPCKVLLSYFLCSKKEGDLKFFVIKIKASGCESRIHRT